MMTEIGPRPETCLGGGGACGSVVVRHYAASQKVTSSSPDEVDEFFQFA
jgi:hypothetical protein